MVLNKNTLVGFIAILFVSVLTLSVCSGKTTVKKSTTQTVDPATGVVTSTTTNTTSVTTPDPEPSVAPKGHYFMEIPSTGTLTIFVLKHDLWFSSASDNRTIAYDSDAFTTIKKGDRKKGQFAAYPTCKEADAFCTIEVKVGGEGALTLASIYTVFGVQMLSVIKSYEIKTVGTKLIATVPNGWSLTEPAK